LIRLMMFCSLLLTTTPARTQPKNHIGVKGKQKVQESSSLLNHKSKKRKKCRETTVISEWCS
jgi:hypothetical protein